MIDRVSIGVRADVDGFGFELFHVYFGTTCNAEMFQGRYDLWPFAKPYDAEQWWSYEDQPEALEAAAALTKYRAAVGMRIAPARISFVKNGQGFQLMNNATPCGMHLFRGEDEKFPWPFGRHPNWPQQKDRASAMKATMKLQEYLDGRTVKLTKNKKDQRHE